MILTQKSDLFGAAASGLCFIHCLATPFLFVAQTCSATCCGSAPIWWKAIDYLFLGVSFWAIYWSVQTTTKPWLKYGLWGMWLALLFVVVNEAFEWIYVPEQLIYLPAIGLIVLHLYNKKYCACKDKECCITMEDKMA